VDGIYEHRCRPLYRREEYSFYEDNIQSKHPPMHAQALGRRLVIS
jgi:hypothetical protein